MFSKQVYGRYVVKDPQLEKDKAYYCNWDLNFAWRDEIPGKIVHDLAGVKNKYGPESFLCVVEVKGILTLGVEVEKEDFLYWFLYNFSKSLQSLFNTMKFYQLIYA